MTAVLSAIAADHATNPRNCGQLPRWDGIGYLQGDCGDEMAVWIDLADGDTIARIAFLTSGCATSHAAGSMATVLASGRSLHEGLHLSQSEVLAALDGLPADHEHCALLAATAVQLACEDALVRRALRPAQPSGPGPLDETPHGA